MRISVDERDPGYANSLGRQFEVRVDDRVLTHCFMADEEAGEAAYNVVDQLGRHVWGVPGNGLLTRTVRGRVQITDITDRRAMSPEPPIKIAVAPDVMVRDLR